MSAANIERSERPLFLEEFVVHPRRNLIEGNASATNVEPKIMDVLCVLMAHCDAVVSREEIIDIVWGAENGGDERLTRAISQLRKAFSDPPRAPRFIETVPKRGYRLVCPVRIERGATAFEPQKTASGPQIINPEHARPGSAFPKNALVLILGAIALAAAAVYFVIS